jgi:hypothetical protein
MNLPFEIRKPLGGRVIPELATSRDGQRGGAKANLLLAIIVLGSMAFAAIKIVPPEFANYQLQDAMQSEARFAMSNRQNEKDIRADIWRKVKELGVPAKEEDIQIQATEAIVKISLSYTVPIDLMVYQFNLNFHPQADNRTI